MKPKRSQIFENYAKIALESGLIDKNIVVKAESMTQEEKYKDSEWKKNIESLYNVKLDNDDILDKAHQNPATIIPTYDKVNSLVENLKERHDIMVGIVNKMPNGSLVGVKYASAHDDLLNELIKIGYSMDNKHIDDLRILADSCSNNLVKKAFVPLVAGIAGGVAAVLALIAIINHTTPSDQGVYNNCEKAILEIQDIIPKMPHAKDLNKLLSDLQFMQKLSTEYNNLSEIDASTPEKFVNEANKNKEKFDLVKKYKSACNYMANEISSYISIIDSYKENGERSFDWWQKIKDVAEYITGNDKEDAILALKTLQKSLIDSVDEANHFMDLARKQEPTLIAAISKFNPEQSEIPQEVAQENKPQNSLQKQIKAPKQESEENFDQSVWEL